MFNPILGVIRVPEHRCSTGASPALAFRYTSEHRLMVSVVSNVDGEDAQNDGAARDRGERRSGSL
jgi:hypothetical protein